MTRITASLLRAIQRPARAHDTTSPGEGTLLGQMWAVLLLVLLFGLVGCADTADPTGPGGTPSLDVELVVLDPSFQQLDVGQQLRLQVEVLAKSGAPITGRTVTWAANPVSVATVDGTGLLRALAAGEALVTATVDGKVGTAQVVISDTTTVPGGPLPTPPAITALSPSSAPAGSGEVEVTVQGSGFEAGTGALWNGAGRPTAFVSDTELRVTLRAQDLSLSGTGRLTVVTQTQGGALASNEMSFVIQPAVTTLTVGYGADIMFPGETIRFIVHALDEQGRVMDDVELSWTSTNPDVVEAAADGTMLARSAGETVIEVRAGGKGSDMSVRVTAAPAGALIMSAYTPFGAARGIMRQTLGGDGISRVLFSGGDTRQPAVSPDGRLLVFVMETEDGGSDLFLMSAGGSGLPRRLTTNPGFDDQPSWSPDSRSIAFRSLRDGLVDIWVIEADGTGLRNLTDFGPYRVGSLGAERPAWSPEGGWVAFAWGDRTTVPSRMSISMIKEDGSQSRRVTQPSAYDDTEPSFSPDGQSLVFRRTGGGAVDQIVVTDLSGNQQYFLWDLGSGRTPRWSPDGQWLAYIREHGAGLTSGPIVLKQIGWSGERRLGGALDVDWMRMP